MAGESYGVSFFKKNNNTGFILHVFWFIFFFFFTQGRYIPVFAAEVYDQNTKLVEAGLTPINLTSVMIGIVFFFLSIKWSTQRLFFLTKVMVLRILWLWFFHTMIWHARLHPFLPSWTSRKLVFCFLSKYMNQKTNGLGPAYKWRQL